MKAFFKTVYNTAEIEPSILMCTQTINTEPFEDKFSGQVRFSSKAALIAGNKLKYANYVHTPISVYGYRCAVYFSIGLVSSET